MRNTRLESQYRPLPAGFVVDAKCRLVWLPNFHDLLTVKRSKGDEHSPNLWIIECEECVYQFHLRTDLLGRFLLRYRVLNVLEPFACEPSNRRRLMLVAGVPRLLNEPQVP